MDLTLRKVDFDKAADEIMARIERDGAIHRSSIVEAMVAVAATVPAVASVVPARGLAAPVVDSEHEAYDKWLAESEGVPTGFFQTKDLRIPLIVKAALRQAEQRRRSERDN